MRYDPSDLLAAIGREQLITVTLDRHVERVEAQRVTLPPGLKAPRHSHPGGVVGYVLEGEIVFEPEGGHARVLRSGDSFFEPPGTAIDRFENASATEPAVFVAFHPLSGEQTTISIEPPRSS